MALGEGGEKVSRAHAVRASRLGDYQATQLSLWARALRNGVRDVVVVVSRASQARLAREDEGRGSREARSRRLCGLYFGAEEKKKTKMAEGRAVSQHFLAR